MEYILREYGLELGVYLVGLVAGLYAVHWYAQGEDRSMAVTGAIFWPITVVVLVALVVIYLLIQAWQAGNPFVWLDRLIGRLTLKKVAADEYGELWRHAAPREPVVFVRVRDHTGTHDIRVPPITKTARAGVAWTYNMTETEYAPLVRV